MQGGGGGVVPTLEKGKGVVGRNGGWWGSVQEVCVQCGGWVDRTKTAWWEPVCVWWWWGGGSVWWWW